MKQVKILLLIPLFLSGCGSHIIQTAKDPVKSITLFLQDQIRDSDIPGIQYVMVDAGSTLINYAGGFSDIKNQLQINPNTTMMAYSMTKTFTAVAILQLAEQGKSA